MSFAWAKNYEPQTALTKWLDEKLPLPRLVYNAVGAGYPVPRNLNYMWNFGVLAGFFLAARLPVAASVLIVVGMEGLAGWMIRDNLALNVLMLLWPVEAVREWQMQGAPPTVR